MSSSAAIHAKAAQLGKLSVRMTALAGSGHPSSALSLAHLVTHLMYREMRYDPRDPWHATADRLVLSEGHAVPIVYAAYADLGGVVGRTNALRGDSGPGDTARGETTGAAAGGETTGAAAGGETTGAAAGGETTGTGAAAGRGVALTVSELDRLRELTSVLDGHPNPAEGFPFFDAATGSLGMGLSVAAGLALAARLDQSPRRVFCIVGDGESREGQIWEAADFIADQRLTAVTAIFNCNGQGQAGNVSPQQSAERLAEKLSAFGWQAVMIDGHDPQAISDALTKRAGVDRPLAIVARTIKGWGAASLQKGNWHGKPPAAGDVDKCAAEIDATAAALGAAGAAPLDGPQRPGEGGGDRSRIQRPSPRGVKWPSFAEAMSAAGLGAAVEKGLLSTRRAYGAALRTAGELLPQVVCLDADVSNSTFSEMFAKACPQRFFECKIAEQNMVSTAAGLSAAGMIPFVNSFAKFIARAYDQVELASISRANVKLVGSHAGISLAADGPSQMAVADVAFFRALTSVRGDDGVAPLCRVYLPSDAVSAYHLTRLMVEQTGLGYMRTHRPDVPLLYAQDAAFDCEGVNVLAAGGELALVASGYMVHVAKSAAALLAKQGRRIGLIDVCMLPVGAEKLLSAVRGCGGRALVVEDNYGGGVGAEAAEIAARAGDLRVQTMSCRRIPKSARTADEILAYCGVGAEQIAARAAAMLK